MPCWSGSGRRATARPRRVSAARRWRNVAVSRSLSAVWIPPSPSERGRSVSTRAGVPSTRRRSRSTTRRWAYRFTTCAMQRLRQHRNRGRPCLPVCTGSRTVSRSARLEERQPSVQHQRGPCAAQRRPRARSRRIRGMSRGTLTSPASPKRVRTISARALPTRSPGVFTRIASACTWPSSRGGSTPSSWTACPCCPARAHHAATVRSSSRTAATL
jgi:hypothetical protein